MSVSSEKFGSYYFLIYICKKLKQLIMISFEEFREEIWNFVHEDKPDCWRNGQAVFNYVDDMYGVAREVQFVSGIDCFYDDSKIEEFIVESYRLLSNEEE